MNYNLCTYDNRVKWQIDCDNTIKDKNNVILSSPTGSGKTKRYEFWALNKPERPIFITSPIKALSNQRFRELQDNGYKVGLETGDIKYIPHDDCDIICCTQEIYNNKYRNYKNSDSDVTENAEEKEASKEEAAPSGNIDLLSYYVHMTVGEEKDIIFRYPEGYTASDFTWSIKKPEIVSVKNGVIKAKKTGNTLVDIKSKDGKYYAACAIYVGEKQ